MFDGVWFERLLVVILQGVGHRNIQELGRTGPGSNNTNRSADRHRNGTLITWASRAPPLGASPIILTNDSRYISCYNFVSTADSHTGCVGPLPSGKVLKTETINSSIGGEKPCEVCGARSWHQNFEC